MPGLAAPLRDDGIVKGSAGIAALSPEFRLVCACCVWPRDEARLARIRERAA